MINTVVVSPEFKRNIKPLVKKYNTLNQSVNDLHEALVKNPYLGISYGSGMFKLRLADKVRAQAKAEVFEYCIIIWKKPVKA